MSSINKFQKNRSVSEGYFMIPLRYLDIYHPQNRNKELCLMESLGRGTYSACWRNNKTNKVGIYFLVQIKNHHIIFKGKSINLLKVRKGWVY